MKIRPVVTEKSLSDAKNGKYTFIFPITMSKFEIKEVMKDAFDVHVKAVKTVSRPATRKRNVYGKIKGTRGVKKAIITLANDEKIDIFDDLGGK